MYDACCFFGHAMFSLSLNVMSLATVVFANCQTVDANVISTVGSLNTITGSGAVYPVHMTVPCGQRPWAEHQLQTEAGGPERLGA